MELGVRSFMIRMFIVRRGCSISEIARSRSTSEKMVGRVVMVRCEGEEVDGERRGMEGIAVRIFQLRAMDSLVEEAWRAG